MLVIAIGVLATCGPAAPSASAASALYPEIVSLRPNGVVSGSWTMSGCSAPASSCVNQRLGLGDSSYLTTPAGSSTMEFALDDVSGLFAGTTAFNFNIVVRGGCAAGVANAAETYNLKVGGVTKMSTTILFDTAGVVQYRELTGISATPSLTEAEVSSMTLEVISPPCPDAGNQTRRYRDIQVQADYGAADSETLYPSSVVTQASPAWTGTGTGCTTAVNFFACINQPFGATGDTKYLTTGTTATWMRFGLTDPAAIGSAVPFAVAAHLRGGCTSGSSGTAAQRLQVLDGATALSDVNVYFSTAGTNNTYTQLAYYNPLSTARLNNMELRLDSAPCGTSTTRRIVDAQVAVSHAPVTISGTVRNANGTVHSECSLTVSNVWLMVDGHSVYPTHCDPTTGAYRIMYRIRPGQVFSVGLSGTAKGATIGKANGAITSSAPLTNYDVTASLLRINSPTPSLNVSDLAINSQDSASGSSYVGSLESTYLSFILGGTVQIESGMTLTMDTGIAATNVRVMSGGTLNGGSATLTLNGGGTGTCSGTTPARSFCVLGTFNPGTGMVSFNPTNNASVAIPGGTYYTLRVLPQGPSASQTVAFGTSDTGNFTVNSFEADGSYSDIAFNTAPLNRTMTSTAGILFEFDVTVTGNANLNSGTSIYVDEASSFAGGGTYTTGTQLVVADGSSLTGSGTWDIGTTVVISTSSTGAPSGSFDVYGQISVTTGANLGGTANWAVGTGPTASSIVVDAATISPVSGTWSTSRNLSIQAGSSLTGGANYTVTGNINSLDGATIAGTGTFSGSGLIQVLRGAFLTGSGTYSGTDLYVEASTMTPSGQFTLTGDMEIYDDSSATPSSVTGTANYSSPGYVKVWNSTLAPASGTWTFPGNAEWFDATIGGGATYNLGQTEFHDSTTVTGTATYNITGTLFTVGAPTISNSGTYNISNNWTNDNDSTPLINGSFTANITNSWWSNPNAVVTLNGSFTANVNNLTTGENATLQGAGNFNVRQHVNGWGTLALTGGVVEMRATANTVIYPEKPGPGWTLGTLIVSNSGTAARTVSNNASAIRPITVLNLLQVGRATDAAAATTNLNFPTFAHALTISGNLDVTTRGIFTMPTAGLTAPTEVHGNFTNNGSLVPGTGLTRIAGLGTTTVSGTGGGGLYDLVIDTPGKAVRLGTNFQYANSMTINGGSCTNPITFYSTSAGATRTITNTATTESIQYVSLRDLSFTENLDTTNAGDLGGTSGITFGAGTCTAPSAPFTNQTNASAGTVQPTAIDSRAGFKMSARNQLGVSADRYRTQVLTSLVEYSSALFAFDGTTTDRSSNANHGTFSGAAQTYPSGATNFGQAAQFNGTNQVFTAADNGGYGASKFSIDLWVRASSFGPADNGVFVSRRLGGTFQFALGWNKAQKQLVGRVTTGGGVTSHYVTAPGLPLIDDTWHHIALTVSASKELRLFADGQQIGSTTTYTGTLDQPSAPIEIGGSGGIATDYFQGMIDDVQYSIGEPDLAELAGYAATLRPHAQSVWKSSGFDTTSGAALTTCATGARCADVTYGTPSIQLEGARYYASHQFRSAAGLWSAAMADWFETSDGISVTAPSTLAIPAVAPGVDQTATMSVGMSCANATGCALMLSGQSNTAALTSSDRLNAISPATPAAPTPGSWPAGTARGLGFTVVTATPTAKDTAKWGTPTTLTAGTLGTLNWFGATRTATTLFQSTGPVSETVTVGARLNAPPAQAVGTYSGTIQVYAMDAP